MDTAVRNQPANRGNMQSNELLSLGQLTKAVTGFLARRMALILSVTGILVLAAVMYSFVATSLYTAEALLIIDARGAQQLADERQPLVDSTKESTFVDSQVEILKSEQIIQKVVNKLGLADLAEFHQTGLVRRVATAVLPHAIISQGEAPTIDAKNRSAIESFKKHLNVERVGLSYVISVSYTSQDREVSADVANSVAEAFVADQLAIRFDLSQDAIKWMQGRLEELRSQTLAADREVQNFKTTKGIVDTSKGLIDEQQISELNSQILTAKQKSIEAESRLSRIRDIMNDPARIGSMPDELNNDVLVNLREQYGTLLRRYQELRLKLGPSHEAVKKSQSEIQHLSGSIQEELSRVSESVKSELQIARANVLMLQEQMKSLQTSWTATNLDLVKMRELETVSQSYHTLYESFLQRFVNTSQQQTFPISESRLITRASPPTEKSSPRRQLILLASVLFGLLLGCLVALLRESMVSVFHTSELVESELGLRCIGMLPHTPKFRGTSRKDRGAKILSCDDGTVISEVGLPATVPQLASIVQLQPFSAYAEALRNAKAELDIACSGRKCSVIGLISAVAGEGKSSTAMNMALFYVQASRRCLVIDCDLRRPTLSDWLDLKAEKGLLQVLIGQSKWRDVLLTGASPSFDVIPAGISSAVANTSDFVGSPAMSSLLDELRNHYDVILLDLPPVAPVPDVAVISPMVDMFLLMVNWGKTPVAVVKHALNGCPQVFDRIVGVLLSDTKPRLVKQYGGVEGYSRYYRRA